MTFPGAPSSAKFRGVADVTKIDATTWVNFLKRSTFYHIYEKRLKMVIFTLSD